MDDKQMYENKRLFVRDFVKPLLIAMGIGVKDCYYTNDRMEIVTVVYAGRDGEGDTSKFAVVNYDSYYAIVKDLYKQNAI